MNALTVKNCYLLPLLSELVNNIYGTQYFTNLEIYWSDNNVCIKEGDEWKAIFQTIEGYLSH